MSVPGDVSWRYIVPVAGRQTLPSFSSLLPMLLCGFESCLGLEPSGLVCGIF